MHNDNDPDGGRLDGSKDSEGITAGIDSWGKDLSSSEAAALSAPVAFECDDTHVPPHKRIAGRTKITYRLPETYRLHFGVQLPPSPGAPPPWMNVPREGYAGNGKGPFLRARAKAEATVPFSEGSNRHQGTQDERLGKALAGLARARKGLIPPHTQLDADELAAAMKKAMVATFADPEFRAAYRAVLGSGGLEETPREAAAAEKPPMVLVGCDESDNMATKVMEPSTGEPGGNDVASPGGKDKPARLPWWSTPQDATWIPRWRAGAERPLVLAWERLTARVGAVDCILPELVDLFLNPYSAHLYTGLDRGTVPWEIWDVREGVERFGGLRLQAQGWRRVRALWTMLGWEPMVDERGHFLGLSVLHIDNRGGGRHRLFSNFIPVAQDILTLLNGLLYPPLAPELSGPPCQFMEGPGHPHALNLEMMVLPWLRSKEQRYVTPLLALEEPTLPLPPSSLGPPVMLRPNGSWSVIDETGGQLSTDEGVGNGRRYAYKFGAGLPDEFRRGGPHRLTINPISAKEFIELSRHHPADWDALCKVLAP